MASPKQPEGSPWSKDLAGLTDTFAAISKQLRHLSVDPFAALKSVESSQELLTRAGVGPPELMDIVRKNLSAECTRAEAEFWGALTHACENEGWGVVGNTNRRLVDKAIFVTLDAHVVTVEGVASRYGPYAPSVMAVLAGELQQLRTSEADLASFLAVVAAAHDDLSPSGAGSKLEGLYRQCVLRVQKPAFWRNPTQTQFVRLSRPAFRLRLSELLRLEMATPDGRVVQLGTTTSTADAWELYSPGEGRVVLAGRLQMTPVGRQQ